MKRIVYCLLICLFVSEFANAQDFTVRTNEIFLDLRKPASAPIGLPLIRWKSPAQETSTSPFPSFIVEAFVSSDVELKSASLIFRNGNVVIGEKSHDVKGVKEKRIRQKLTLNDGPNVVEIVVEDMNGNKASSLRTLTLGNYTFDKNQIASATEKITVRRIELDNDKLNLYYDLTDSIPSNTYVLSLYSSHDNFMTKQENVTGDIGVEIKTGSNHKLTWNVKEVLGADFNGKLRVELRAKLFEAFIRISDLRKSYRRGKDFSLAWKGDASPAVLNFDLYKGDELIYPFANIANNGQTTLRIPTSVKPDHDYYFKISDINDKNRAVKTTLFSLKRKTPLLLKVLPVALVGGAAAALGGGSSGGGQHTIPDPLAPTSIH